MAKPGNQNRPGSHKDVLVWAAKNGCTLSKSNGGHIKITCPSGAVTFASSTTANQQAGKKLYAILKREGVGA